MQDHTLLFNAFVYLGAAVIAVPICKRLGLGSVLGYLLAGIVIGPWGIGLITNVEDILHFAEFGVVLLLFLIGLELEPNRLWSMRKPILGTGGLQLLLTTALFFSVGFLFEVSWQTQLLAALTLSLSSTAIALQTLNEKNQMGSPAGRTGFAILLFQDIAIIPILALLPLLAMEGSPTGGADDLSGIMSVVGVIIAIILGGRYITAPILRYIAATGLREIFTAFSLLLVIGISLLMAWVDISMALGAFLAGVVLAESEYRHALEIDIEPFKGLLLGLFFISVGMSIDFGLLLQSPLIICALAIALVAIKALVLFGLGLRVRLPDGQLSLFTVVLSQGGEFAFVLFGAAKSAAVMPVATADTLMVVVTLSMLTTPFLIMFNDHILEPRFSKKRSTMEYDVQDENSPVIIAGFGRFGQIIGRMLHANRIPTTILDHDPHQVTHLRKHGFKVFYGDASRMDLLGAAGAASARILVLATDDREHVLKTIKHVKEYYPHLKIISRAWDMVHVHELMKLEVEYFQRETFESALLLGESVLTQLDFTAYQAKQAAHRFRDYDERLMYKLFDQHRDDPASVTSFQKAHESLEELYDADDEALHQDRNSGWG